MRPGKSAQRGVALLMVIWVLAALGIILSEFVFASRSSLNAVRNQKEEATAYYLAQGAFRMAQEEIRQAYLYLEPGAEDGLRFVRAGEDDKTEEPPKRRLGNIPGAGKYSYRITDEESKININRADRKQLVELLRIAGVPMGAERDTIVDSMLDWRDQDELHRLNGAEDDYYLSLAPPYHAKNANFTSVEETLLVKGMTSKILSGKGRDGEGSPLLGLMTVHGERPNYNTAPAEVLTVMLGAAEAEKIIAARKAGPYRDGRGQSSFFSVTAEGQAEGSTFVRRIRAVVNRKGAAAKAGDISVLQWIDVAPPGEASEDHEE